MKIRIADADELDEIKEIYTDARAFMKESGNPLQWAGGYPSEELLLSDIRKRQLFVIEDEGRILASFVYFFGEEETYGRIYGGSWLSDEKYGVIHRVAVSKNAHGRGLSRKIFDFAYEKCGNVRIDTHKDNIPMQKALLKSGFVYCGLIYLDNGAERMAYQRV